MEHRLTNLILIDLLPMGLEHGVPQPFFSLNEPSVVRHNLQPSVFHSHLYDTVSHPRFDLLYKIVVLWAWVILPVFAGAMFNLENTMELMMM